MPNKVIAMLIIRRLILLIQREFSIRGIADELKISSKTVEKYRHRINMSGKTPEELLALDDLSLAKVVVPQKKDVPDPRIAQLMPLLDGYLSELELRRSTRLILYEEYQKEYPDGFKYSKFCQLLSESGKVRKATLHNEYIPGDKWMFDFAGKKLGYIDPLAGELKEVPVFVSVLPYSSYCYMEALEDSTIPELVKALNNNLSYFGGVPACGKTDNMKQVVSKASRYEPEFTEAIDQWSVHNGIAMIAARVRKPRDKAATENQVKISYNQIYARIRDQDFLSLKELNAAIRVHLDELNRRPMQKKGYSRYQRFMDLEKPALKPLPEHPFVLKHRAQRKIGCNYHFKIQEDKHQYSVPYHYIGKTLTAIYDTDTVEIYDGLERILVYRRIHGEGYTTHGEHMPPNHRAYKEQQRMDGDYFLKWAEQIGPFTKQYIQGLLQSRNYQEQSYDSCLGILRLAKKSTIGNERMEWACRRGLRIGRFGYRIINNVLMHNQDKLEQQYSAETQQHPPIQHENLRGPEYYQ